MDDKVNKVAKIFGFDTFQNDGYLKSLFVVMVSIGESENIAEIFEVMSTQSQEAIKEYRFILANAICNEKEDIEIINSRKKDEKKRINSFKSVYISIYIVVGIIALSYLLGNTKSGFLVFFDICTLILSGVNHYNGAKGMNSRRKKLDILLQIEKDFPTFINHRLKMFNNI